MTAERQTQGVMVSSERMKPAHFLRDIVKPALHELAFFSDRRIDTPAARQLMMLTAAVESDFKHTTQKGGPAVSYFQIEEGTFNDVQKRFDLGGYKLRFNFAPLSEGTNLDQKCACKIARAKYWLASDPLPHEDDWIGMAEYWLNIYNTHEGAGDTLKAKQKIRRYRLDALEYKSWLEYKS